MFFEKEKLLFERQFGGDLNVLNCFPNTYEIAMASLGFQSIFRQYASHNQTHCFRRFTNIAENHPKDIDLVTFSISWELDFFNLFKILHDLGIPLKANERGPEHPLILGGGPVLTANPEPWAEFFDLICIGDSEENTDSIITTSLAAGRNTLEKFTEIPGVYVPSLKNNYERQKSKSDKMQMSSVITSESCWPDVGLLEVVRSCPEMCTFCLASFAALPFRAPSFEKELLPKVDILLKHTQNIGLLGASVTQHPEFMSLLEYLARHEQEPQVQVASVRAATVNDRMCELLVKSGTKNLTIAIESGSQRLRDQINKKLPEEYIFSSAQAAAKAKMKQIKLYGMVGLPHESEEDIELTIDLLTRIKKENKTLKIIWGCSVFTPKKLTPYEIYGVDEGAEKKLKKLIKALRPQGIEVREESFKWAQVQALISRGDRSIADVMLRAFQSGKTGFGIYKKLMDPVDYKHFVFDDWL